MTETVTAVPGAPLLGERVTVRAATSTVAVAVRPSSEVSVTLTWFIPLAALLGIRISIEKSSSFLVLVFVRQRYSIGFLIVRSHDVRRVQFRASKLYLGHGDCGAHGKVLAGQSDGVLRLARGRGRQGRPDGNPV